MGAAAIIGLKIISDKRFWLLVGLVLLYFVVRKFWSQLSRIGEPKFIDYEKGEDGKVIGLNDERKKELEDLAMRVHEAIYGSFLNSKESVFKEVNVCNDQELQYLAKFYKKAITRGQTSLYQDISDEWMYSTDIDEKLEARLKKIGEY